MHCANTKDPMDSKDIHFGHNGDFSQTPEESPQIITFYLLIRWWMKWYERDKPQLFNVFLCNKGPYIGAQEIGNT